MHIKNTTWQTISEENKKASGLVFGYEAPATTKLLQQLQKNQILVEVVEKKPQGDVRFIRLIRPDNNDSQVFHPDDKFRIMESNSSFDTFEKFLANKCDGFLPENRFDEFIAWTDPTVYAKNSKGYSLPLTHLSEEKKQELKENLTGYSPSYQFNQLLITGKGNIEALEFTWKMAKKQNKLTRVLSGASNRTKSIRLSRNVQNY